MHISQLLVGLVSSYRYEREVVDLAIANSEALTLNEAIKTKKLDQDHVVWILSVRNFYQLKATFECYEKNYGNAIDKVLPQESILFDPFVFIFILGRNHLANFLDRTLRAVGRVICKIYWEQSFLA